MKTGIIDVDGRNYPNIPLMKISAFHKSRGDTVEWCEPLFGQYDIVYKSKVFSFSKDENFCINADRVVTGGTGYAIRLVNGREVYDKASDKPLPAAIEHITPDYSIYPQYADTAFGFLTRGCPRACAFCHVTPKEGGKSVKVADLSEFWDGQKNIVLCDPNLLACREWRELLKQLKDGNANIDINQGLDARLMTEEKSAAVAELNMKEIHFAWDRWEDRDVVLRGLRIYAAAAKTRPHSHNATVFTIVNFDTTFEKDLERIYTLREMGYWACVMIYDKEHCGRRYLDLQRWVNNRFIFASCERFEDYVR